MINANKILRQINSLTEDLITTSLCDDQNFPHVITKSKNMVSVCIGNLGTTIFLKNVPYKEIYNEMRKRRLFNFKMIDGALVLMEYTCNKRELIHHRLCFSRHRIF